MAEHEQLIKRLFLEKETKEEFYYKVKISRQGTWRQVLVDDYFPCFPMDKPIFTTSVNKDLWALILEKAYAKLNGGYQSLEEGDIRHSLVDFTGCPVFTFKMSDPEIVSQINSGELWRLLNEWKRQKYLLAAGTKHFQEERDLLEDHAYGILRVVEIEENKIMNLRNPWGTIEWDGDWSPNSKKWSKEIKEFLKIEEEEATDNFWISFQDFVKNFEILHVGKISNWAESRQIGKWVQTVDKNNDKVTHFCSRYYYEMTLSSSTRVIVGVH